MRSSSSSAQRREHAAGYSLIELTVVVAVVALLASLSVPLLERVQRREREQELRRALWAMRDAIDQYKRASDDMPNHEGRTASGYPANFDALVQGLMVIGADGQARRRLFLRRVPRDPFSPAEQGAAQGWQLRSYSSDPQHPREGAHIYDLQSRSEEVGLNGLPYRQW